MKKILISLLTFTFSFLSSAQQYDCNCGDSDGSYNMYLQNLLISREYYNPVSYYRGEQFYNTWAPGEVELLNGEKITDINLRYHKFLDELLWLRNSDFKTAIVNKSIVSGFTICDANQQVIGRFTKERIKLPGMAAFDAYLEILAEGKIGFYVFRNVVRAISESRVVDNTTYYLSLNNEEFHAVRLKKKSFIRFPGIDSELMKSIIRSNHISFRRNESNAAVAVRLYNEAVMQ